MKIARLTGLSVAAAWWRRLFTADRVIAAGGIALAGFAAFFPWYVFLHQEKFGIRPMVYSRDPGDIGSWPGTGLFASSRLSTAAPGAPEDAPEAEFDPFATGTVPAEDAEKGREDEGDPYSQPFPNTRPFSLVHVANGRALIEDDSGMYIVRVGSILPDSSRVSRLVKQGDSWAIVTSTGSVISR